MPITFGAHLGTSRQGAGTNYSFTVTAPTSGRTAELFVQNTKSTGAADTPTVSGLGLTWTQEATVLYDAGTGTRVRGTWFHGTGTPDGGTSLTVDYGAASQNSCGVSLSDWNGCDSTDPTVQSITGSAGTGTSITLTLSSAPGSGAVMGGVAARVNEAISEGTGFTEIGEAGAASPNLTLESEYQLANDQTIDFSWTTSAANLGIGVELRSAATEWGPLLSHGRNRLVATIA